MSVLAIKNLSKSYGNTKALDGVSLTIEKGQIFGFLGPNGAGKSTTLNIIMDFLRPNGGTVEIFGKDSHVSSVELKRNIGHVSADPVVYLHWTVDEHIAFVSRLRGDIRQKAHELKDVLGLDGTKKVRELSTGNRQKLAIILALAPQPELLILDEPTRGLDPLLRATFHELLKNYRASSGTVLLSSHDLNEVEELCDKVAIIHKGKIIQNTTIAGLRANHQHKVTVSFADKVPDFSLLTDIDALVIKNQSATFTVKGNIDSVIKFLARSSVSNIEVASASLEDIFREIYQ